MTKNLFKNLLINLEVFKDKLSTSWLFFWKMTRKKCFPSFFSYQISKLKKTHQIFHQVFKILAKNIKGLCIFYFHVLLCPDLLALSNWWSFFFNHPIYSPFLIIRQGASQVQFFFWQWVNLIGPSLKYKKNIEAPKS